MTSIRNDKKRHCNTILQIRICHCQKLLLVAPQHLFEPQPCPLPLGKARCISGCIALLLCSVILYRSSTSWASLPPVTVFKQEAWRTNELTMTFLRLSDAHMHQCLHVQLPCMHTCVHFCVYLYILVQRWEERRSCEHRQQRTFWTPVILVNSLGVLAFTLFFQMWLHKA